MNWKNTLGVVAPTLAAAVGGPMAGLAVKTMLEATGLADEEQLAKAVLSGDPAVLTAIKTAENDFLIRMEELDIAREKLAVQDRGSARKMFEFNIWPQISLSILFVGGYFGIIYLIFSGSFVLAEGIRDMANILLGVLTAGIPMILRFWFGGSPQDASYMDKIYNSVPRG